MKLIFKADRPRTVWDACSTISCETELFRALAETPANTLSVLDCKHRGGTGCFTLTEQLSQVKIKLLVVWVKCKVNASPQSGEKQRIKAEFSWVLQCCFQAEEACLHWAPMPRKELSVELGHNTWPYLYMRTRLSLFLPINAIKTNFL